VLRRPSSGRQSEDEHSRHIQIRYSPRAIILVVLRHGWPGPATLLTYPPRAEATLPHSVPATPPSIGSSVEGEPAIWSVLRPGFSHYSGGRRAMHGSSGIVRASKWRMASECHLWFQPTTEFFYFYAGKFCQRESARPQPQFLLGIVEPGTILKAYSCWWKLSNVAQPLPSTPTAARFELSTFICCGIAPFLNAVILCSSCAQFLHQRASTHETVQAAERLGTAALV